MKKKNEYRERNALTAQSFELELDRSGLYLEVLRLHYERTGNPLFVWKAIQQAHELKLAIPDWVMEYLRESADQLLEIDGGLGSKMPDAIAEALSLKATGSGRSPVTKYQKELRDIQICLRVMDLKEQAQDRKDSLIFATVGKDPDLGSLGASQVGKIFKQHYSLFMQSHSKQPERVAMSGNAIMKQFDEAIESGDIDAFLRSYEAMKEIID